jgi:molybdenum cofactor cytidylyltransferase
VKVGAIVLAAGDSTRFGESKQLLVFEGETLVRRAARAALAVRGPVVVVTGRDHDRIANELHGLPVTVVPNDQWLRGIGSSIRCGIEALGKCDAAVLLACDQPHVSEQIVRQLIAAHEMTRKPIVISAYAETVGIPALFSKYFFSELRAIDDENGAKSIILAHEGETIAVPFEAGRFDVDTPGDLQKFASSSS